jgi:hypothetical protein
MKARHQGLDANTGFGVGVIGEVGVAGGGENGIVAQNLLNFQQVNAGLDQVCCIAVAKTVRGDLFFRPQARAT